MASSKSPFHTVIHTLRSVAARLVGPRLTKAAQVPATRPAPPHAEQPIIVPAQLRPRSVRTAGQRAPVQRVPRSPVRVLRVAEAGSRRVAGARMVISGRLADVCAELDRLAALEAAAT